MIEKKKLFYFIYLLIIFFLIFEILFAKKNIFTVFDNFEKIKKQKQLLSSKTKELDAHEKFITNFESMGEFQKVIVKDKLFYKDINEKILLYEFSNSK